MSHPFVVAVFSGPTQAATAARALHTAGVTREQISIVSRNHDEESSYARDMDGTPGAEIEDSRAAARLGELSGHVLAAIALVLPGIGPIVAAGPLAAGLGEAAGHVAGGVATTLRNAGIGAERAESLEAAVEGGAILLAVHTIEASVSRIRSVLQEAGAAAVDTGRWTE
jgi:hypothetical protein